MPNLEELPNESSQLSLFPKQCKALNPKSKYRKYLFGDYEPTNHCNGYPCYTCGVACCNHPDIEKFIEDVDGLDFSSVKAKGSLPLTLPLFIPSILSNGFKNKINLPLVALPVSEIFRSQPRKEKGFIKIPKSKLKEDIKKSFGLFPDNKIILLSYGSDKLIEEIWLNGEKDFFPKLKNLDIEMATAFNFSLFFGECRLGQRINLKKSLKTFEMYQKYNIPSIPHIYWLNKFDLDEWITWLSANPNVKMIAINLQTFKKDQYNFILKGIEYLIKNSPNPPFLFLNGQFGLGFLKELSKITKNVSISNLVIYMKAQCSQRLVKNNHGLGFIYDNKFSKEKIFEYSIQLYEKELREIFIKSNHGELLERSAFPKVGILLSRKAKN